MPTMTGFAPQSLTGNQPTQAVNTPILGNPNAQYPVYQNAAPVSIPQQTSSAPVLGQPNQNVPQTGLIGSEQALNAGYNAAQNILGGPSTASTSANKLMADLSGASGAAAQTNAYNQFQQSPATKYLMDQMQQATERSQAAKGGLLSGNTLRALQENAAGIASQDFQNQFNNLGSVADRGTQINSMLANLRNNLGIDLASGRTNAGLAIASNASNTANNIANLLNNQGIQVSGNLGNSINTISNMIHDYGLQDSVDASTLAQILANISGGQASNIQNAQNAIGSANAAGVLGTNAAVQNAITQGLQLGAFSPKTTTAQPVSMLGSGQNFSGVA